MTYPQPVSPPPNPHYLRRLGCLTFFLTFLLAIVLVLYAWPIVYSFFAGPRGQPRPVTPRGDLMSIETTTNEIFTKASPSVCFITTETRRYTPFSRRPMEVPQGSGSGFVWDDQGHIVTNFHVINGASKAHVILYDQSSYNASVVGYSVEHDLAVLKINVPLGVKLIPIPVGASGDLKVGQSTFAIGNPFGLDQTLTTGVISALNRSISNGETGRVLAGLIQTDAAINPGNSGGVLLDSAGRLIGVNTAIYSTSGGWSGIGFAIPVDTTNKVVPEIIRTGHYTRGILGVHYSNADSQALLADKKVLGVVIIATTPDSPAARAGLEGITVAPDESATVHDVITRVNGRLVRSGSDMASAMDAVMPGDPVKVTLWNSGTERELTIKADSPPRGE